MHRLTKKTLLRSQYVLAMGLSLSLGGPCGQLWAQYALAHSSSEISQEVRDEVDALIAGLGTADFLEREKASLRLLELGETALPQLRTISSSATFEVRHRAEMVRTRIEDDKFTALSQSFLLDSVDEHSYGLPAWDAYRNLVGTSRTSKLLFLEMIREQPDIAQLIERTSVSKNSQEAENALAVYAAGQAAGIRETMYSIVEPRMGDAVAMLMVASTLSVQTPVEISEVIIGNDRRSFGGNIHKQGYGSCLRKLIAAWIPKAQAAMAPTVMEMALTYSLPEGADIARKHLTPNFDNATRKLAFYCLARFGLETDLPLILPLLDDDRVVDIFSWGAAGGEIHVSNTAPPGATRDRVSDANLVVRINDFALATAMLLLKENPASVFPRFEANSKNGFFLHSLASPADAVEDQARRIQEWKASHLPKRIES